MAKKPRFEWNVYGRRADGVDIPLGTTLAVSDKQACNQIRRRRYGDKPYCDIRLFFWAERVKTAAPGARLQSGEFLFH